MRIRPFYNTEMKFKKKYFPYPISPPPSLSENSFY